MRTKGAIGAIAAMSALILLVGVSGCGGADDSALTKTEFVKQANALCQKNQKERFQMFEAEAKRIGLKPGEAASTSEREAAFKKVIGETYDDQITELEDLGAPAGEEEKLGKIFAAMQKADKELIADPGSYLEPSTPFDEPNKLLSDYGVEACGA